MNPQFPQLQELIADSREWLRLSIKRGHDFSSLLVGSYNDASHFIYEILQNAEDAKDEKTTASYVRFKLFDDKLEVYHDGKDFDFNDLDAIVSIGKSTKQSDTESIGKFGVGFKSVYAVTKTPYIYSGDFNIRIEDFVIPVPVEESWQGKGTKFVLPFTHDQRSTQSIYSLTANRLENLGLKTLLFLNNIKEINWETPTKSGHYLKDSIKIPNFENVYRVFLTSSEDISEEYIVINRPIRIGDKDLKVEVAYRISKNEDGIEAVAPDNYSKLVVFFPTQKDTYLNFLLQAPYRTTTNRENILQDDDINKIFIEETAILVADSLSVIKQLGYLNTDFLCLLPLRNEHQNEPIYHSIFQSVKDKLSSGAELLPTKDGEFASAGDALLARGKDITELLLSSDTQILFSRNKWLDTNITSERTKTRELWDYLISDLKVKKIEFEDFVKVITTDFLSDKSDEWVIALYTQLRKQKGLWQILKKKPIVRLDDNSHIEPLANDGKAQVYLPNPFGSSYKTVKKEITSNEEALGFLKDIGLSEPDIFAEIKELILPKYQNGKGEISEEKYNRDIDVIINAYEQIQSYRKTSFLKELGEVPFLRCADPKTDTISFHIVKSVYFPKEDLMRYFSNNDHACFIDEAWLKNNEKYLYFIEAVGVKDKPRKIQIEGILSGEEKQKLRGNAPHSWDVEIKDFTLDGIEHVLDLIDYDLSVIIWNILLGIIGKLKQDEIEEYFQGEYSWSYGHKTMTSHFPAKFLKLLWSKKWLFNNSGVVCCPSDIEVVQLASKYDTTLPEAHVLIRKLHFKPTIEQQLLDKLPEKEKLQFTKLKELQQMGDATGRTIDEILDTALEMMKAGSSQKKSISTEEEWNPEVKAGEITSAIEKVNKEKIHTDIESEHEVLVGDKPESIKVKKNDDDNTEDNSDEMANKNTKDIGRWGEEHVFASLKKHFAQSGNCILTPTGFQLQHESELIEVIWLNLESEKGEGCDFIIKKHGANAEYIEVKATRGGKEELVQITGKQWQFARELFDKGEGYKYSFYRVLSAGSTNAEIKVIQNPIQLWVDGKLYAHPIHFKL